MYEDKTYHINDKILKNVIKPMTLVLNYEGNIGKIVYHLPTVRNFKFNEYIMDYACILSDGRSVDFEFQKTIPTKEDLVRFIIYNGLLFYESKDEENSEIIIIALYPTDGKEIEVKINESTTFKFRVICLKNINKDKEYELIRYKINNIVFCIKYLCIKH